MNKITAYFRDSYKEMVEKVTWPGWDQLTQSTVIVLGATLFITAMVFVMDFVSDKLMDTIYKMFN